VEKSSLSVAGLKSSVPHESLAAHHASHRMSLKQFIPAVIVGLLLAALPLWLTLGWLLDAITRPVG
jgi:hypothetical protein